jgi:UDP-N-acetylglucosamine 1-carboxyvinyltransferase
LTLENVEPSHLGAVIAKLEEMGCKFSIAPQTMTIHPAKTLKPIKIITQEYPGFPTDMQAQFLALATQANGVSIIEERLFENRFMHVSELQRMGANITLSGNIATVVGKTKLSGTDVMATDLRASSALVLAAMVAEGITNVHRIYHLDRGYDSLEKKLENVGAKIKRLQE